MSKRYWASAGVVLLAAVAVFLTVSAQLRPERAPRPSSGAAGSLLAPVGKIGESGITIGEALSSQNPETLLVRGFLIRDGATLRLCSSLTDGRCGEPSLRVEGEPGVEPSDQETRLLGKLAGDTLRVVNLAAA